MARIVSTKKKEDIVILRVTEKEVEQAFEK